jgi:hypothetical protein
MCTWLPGSPVIRRRAWSLHVRNFVLPRLRNRRPSRHGRLFDPRRSGRLGQGCLPGSVRDRSRADAPGLRRGVALNGRPHCDRGRPATLGVSAPDPDTVTTPIKPEHADPVPSARNAPRQDRHSGPRFAARSVPPPRSTDRQPRRRPSRRPVRQPERPTVTLSESPVSTHASTPPSTAASRGSNRGS